MLLIGDHKLGVFIFACVSACTSCLQAPREYGVKIGVKTMESLLESTPNKKHNVDPTRGKGALTKLMPYLKKNKLLMQI